MRHAADPYQLAYRYGIAIALCDFGEGAARTLIAEYEPAGPLIRINTRALASASDPVALARHAVAHELYHHRERLGKVARLPAGREREAAADAYARALMVRA